MGGGYLARRGLDGLSIPAVTMVVYVCKKKCLMAGVMLVSFWQGFMVRASYDYGDKTTRKCGNKGWVFEIPELPSISSPKSRVFVRNTTACTYCQGFPAVPANDMRTKSRNVSRKKKTKGITRVL